MKAEIRICADQADVYLCDKIPAPLYRLPLVAWNNAYPVLLAGGALKVEQVTSLHKFYNAVETFNRGLDQADAARDNDTARGDNKSLREEHSRLIIKAKAINTKSDLYQAALGAF